MNNITIQPIKLDCQNLRLIRQNQNNKSVYDAIQTKNKEQLLQVINNIEFERVLQETNLSIDQLIDKCSQDHITNIILSGRISKNATRQGTKDEELQINVCKETASKYGITISTLPNTAYRPTKSGEIISLQMMKDKNISKDECLKSFDGKIEGQINGWIFAKVVYGNGGHQDNVFEEADTLCKWVVDYQQNNNILYVILLDTDLDCKKRVLVEKYQHIKNILITNHFEFQNYIIQNYTLL
jgi:hypothetical protein